MSQKEIDSVYDIFRKRQSEFFDKLPDIPGLGKKQQIQHYIEMGRYSDTMFIDPLLRHLSKQQDREVCTAITQAIAAIGEDAIPFLMMALESAMSGEVDTHLTSYIMVALTANNEAEHLEKLIPYLKNATLAPFVIECLIECREIAIPIIIQQLSYPHLEVRRWLKQILVELPQAAVFDVLEMYEILPEEDTLIELFGESAVVSLPGSQRRDQV